MKDGLFQMNLQLFSDGFAGAVDAMMNEGSGAETLDAGPDATPEAPETPEAAAPSLDIEKYFKDFEQKLPETLKSILKTEEPEVPEEPEAPEEPADPEAVKEEFFNKFYDDPLANMNEIIKQAIEEDRRTRSEQMQAEQSEQQKWDDVVTGFMEKHTDFPKYQQDMLEIIADNDFLQNNEKGLEVAYNMAKGQKISSIKSFDEMLTDNMDKVLSKPEIQEAILKNYFEGLTKGKAPAVISNTPRAISPVTPPSERPKTFADAIKGFLESEK